MISRELKEDVEFSKIYPKWLRENANPDTAEAAYNAGYLICTGYEKPGDTLTQAEIRANTAKIIYNAMINA